MHNVTCQGIARRNWYASVQKQRKLIFPKIRIFYIQTKILYIAQQPRPKSDHRPADKQDINREYTADQPRALFLHLSSPKPEHTTGGSGRGARRGDWAGSGRIGCQQNCSPRKQRSLVPSKASKKRRLSVSPEARTSETLRKPNAGTKSAVDNQFIRGLSAGPRALFLPGCWPEDRRLVSVNPCHARNVREFILVAGQSRFSFSVGLHSVVVSRYAG